MPLLQRPKGLVPLDPLFGVSSILLSVFRPFNQQHLFDRQLAEAP